MKISTQGIEINKRFFEAIELLRKKRKIRGLQTFTREFGINYWNMNTVRNEPDKRVLKPEWINFLCSKYGVSAEWVILGKDTTFNK